MMNTTVLNRLTPASEMVGEDDSDTRLLKEMLLRAEAYLKSFQWCPAVVERFFGCGVGGVVAVFLFRVSTRIDGTDDLLWVVEGDLPSAYLVTDDAPDPASALSTYVGLMEAWARAVLEGSSLAATFPVSAPPTPQYANMLLSRTQFIRERIIPPCRTKWAAHA